MKTEKILLILFSIPKTIDVFLPRSCFAKVTPFSWNKIKNILFQNVPAMKNPFIGKDGHDYHSYEDLQDAKKNWFRLNNPDTIQVFKKVA